MGLKEPNNKPIFISWQLTVNYFPAPNLAGLSIIY